MTNPNEKPWWIDDKYWWPYDPELGHQAKHVDMIAEATRRGIQQGKREAWEEAGEMVRKNQYMSANHGALHMKYSIEQLIDAKLAALDNSSKE